ncbi:MAG: HNH endonuclease [Candidatus Odinarchaeota archaeon]
MNSNCIYCGVDISKNYSTEHIIPANIGGKLKSNKIVCRKCNSLLGTELDDELHNKFGIFDNLLELKKERGKTAKVIAEYDGKKYRLMKGEPVLDTPYPKYENNKIKLMVYPNKQVARKLLKRMKRKNPSINIDVLIKKAIIEEIKFLKPLTINIDGIDEKTWRICGKIVYGFLRDTFDWYTPSNSLFIEFINGNLTPKDYPICFGYIDYNPLDKYNDNIYHIIVVEGREDENIIIGYLEIFNFLKVIMLIDDNYKSTSFLKGYYHDLVTHQYDYFEPKSKIPVELKELKKLFEDCINLKNLEFLEQELGNAIQKSKHQRLIKNVLETIFKEYKDKSLEKNDFEQIVRNLLIDELNKYGMIKE